MVLNIFHSLKLSKFNHWERLGALSLNMFPLDRSAHSDREGLLTTMPSPGKGTTRKPRILTKWPRKNRERPKTLRAHRLKKFDLAWNFQSRSQISVSLENFNLDLQNSPRKIGFGGRLAWNFQSRSKTSIPESDLEIFQSLGPSGKAKKGRIGTDESKSGNPPCPSFPITKNLRSLANPQSSWQNTKITKGNCLLLFLPRKSPNQGKKG